MTGSLGLSPVLVRTVRALALCDKPICPRALAGSFRLSPTVAALRWLRERGFVDSGTSHTGSGHRVPVYWLTDDGIALHHRLCAAT
jgi:hypothetical protein